MTRLVHIKLLDTAVWLFFAGCIVAIPVMGGFIGAGCHSAVRYCRRADNGPRGARLDGVRSTKIEATVRCRDNRAHRGVLCASHSLRFAILQNGDRRRRDVSHTGSRNSMFLVTSRGEVKDDARSMLMRLLPNGETSRSDCLPLCRAPSGGCPLHACPGIPLARTLCAFTAVPSRHTKECVDVPPRQETDVHGPGRGV
jgi:hypothetical protein